MQIAILSQILDNNKKKKVTVKQMTIYFLLKLSIKIFIFSILILKKMLSPDLKMHTKPHILVVLPFPKLKW